MSSWVDECAIPFIGKWKILWGEWWVRLQTSWICSAVGILEWRRWCTIGGCYSICSGATFFELASYLCHLLLVRPWINCGTFLCFCFSCKLGIVLWFFFSKHSAMWMNIGKGILDLLLGWSFARDFTKHVKQDLYWEIPIRILATPVEP